MKCLLKGYRKLPHVDCMTQRFWQLIEVVKVWKPSTTWPLTLLHSFTCKTGDIINLPPPSCATKKGLFRGILSLKLPISKLLTKQNTLHLYISMLAIYIHRKLKDQNLSGTLFFLALRKISLSFLIHIMTEALVPTHLQFHPGLPRRWALIHTSLYISYNLLRFPSICDKTGLPIETEG